MSKRDSERGDPAPAEEESGEMICVECGEEPCTCECCVLCGEPVGGDSGAANCHHMTEDDLGLCRDHPWAITQDLEDGSYWCEVHQQRYRFDEDE